MKLKRLSAVALSAVMATTVMVPFSAFADQQPSVEYTGGNGQPITKLTLIANDTDLVTNYGPEDGANSPKLTAKVEVPVAINYVAQANGTIAGPSNNQAQIRNYGGFAVHVSNMFVSSANGATLVSTASDADSADEIYLQMQPESGTVISLGDFTATATASASGLNDGTGKKPTQGEWNIAAVQSNANTASAVASVLNLNSLTGKIGGFGTLHPDARTEIGQISWQVAPGTEQASRVTKASTSNGSFVVAASALGTSDEVVAAGDTAYIVATPETGYVVDEMTVEKVSDSTDVTVTRDAGNDNIGSFTMPNEAVEVMVTFEEENAVPSVSNLSAKTLTQIKAAANDIRLFGTNSEYWTEYLGYAQTGQSITVNLADNSSKRATLVDVSQSRGLIFQMDSIANKPMNLGGNGGTNLNGWIECDLRSELRTTGYTDHAGNTVSQTLYSQYLSNITYGGETVVPLSTHNITSGPMDNGIFSGSGVIETDDYFWIPGIDEIYSNMDRDGDSTQYTYYAAQQVQTYNRSALDYNSGNGFTMAGGNNWWLRSADSGHPSTSHFLCVAADGSLGFYASYYENAVTPCFRL